MDSASKTILVVDDFKNIADVVRTTLQMQGYRTLVATSGEEALAILSDKETKIDMVVSDYNMPNMTGLELLKKTKAITGYYLLPFIILTTEKNPERMKEAKRLGLSAWIQKPYKLQNFIDQVAYILKKNDRTASV